MRQQEITGVLYNESFTFSFFAFLHFIDFARARFDMRERGEVIEKPFFISAKAKN